MSPEQIGAVSQLVAVLRTMSTWPFGLAVFLFVIGPWVLAMFLSWAQSKRFEAVVKMYESNVKLVEQYERVATDLKEMVVMNTQALTRLCDRFGRGDG